MPSLLVTNDYPPKIGGIQSVLWEMWRRLPPNDTVVLTTPYDGAAAWDRVQEHRVERTREPVLLPNPWLRSRIDRLADDIDADVVFLDPMLPVGALGPLLRRDRPYVVVAHGAEITAYGRVPPSNLLARQVLRRAAGVVAFGSYPMAECVRTAGGSLRGAVVPCGVDIERFVPLDDTARAEARTQFGLDPDRPVVLGVSRLVPRKGFDVLIEAVGALGRDVQLVIGGSGRDRERLERVARERGVAVQFLGRVPDADMPRLYGCADVFTMLCRADRWGGLEAEGFGIVFLEAAACGVPQIAGRSGGSHEAVADGETGYVVEPRDVAAVTDALRTLLDDAALRTRMGVAARTRAVESFGYDVLVPKLLPIARGDFSGFEEFAP